LDGKRAFIFSTAGTPIKATNHRLLRKILKEKGFTIVGEWSCRGCFDGINKGHPNKRDLKRAMKFAEKIKNMLSF